MGAGVPLTKRDSTIGNNTCGFTASMRELPVVTLGQHQLKQLLMSVAWLARGGHNDI